MKSSATRTPKCAPAIGAGAIVLIWLFLTCAATGAAVADLPELPSIAPEHLSNDVRSLMTAARAADAVTRPELCAHLAAMGQPGADALILLMAATDENLRWEAVAAMASAKRSNEGRTALRAMLADSSWAVRSEAARSLGATGDPSDVVTLRQLAEDDTDQIVRTTALQAAQAIATRPSKQEPPNHAPTLQPIAPMNALDSSVSVASMPNTAPTSHDPTIDDTHPVIAPTFSVTSSPTATSPAMATSDAIDRPGNQAIAAPTTVAVPSMTHQRPMRPEDVMFPMPSPDERPQTRPAATGALVTAEEVQRSARTIDAYIDRKMEQVGLKPSARATDGEFLRRLSLDLTGVIPTAQTTTEFVLTGSGGKRPDVIDRLVASDAALDHWTDLWTQWLVGAGQRDAGDVQMLRSWLRQSLSDNMPYDQMVRHLLTTQGPTHEDGAANYLLRLDLDPVELAARTSRTFLGLPLQCAECHDHKSEPWKQTQFYGVAAFFNSIDREEIKIEVEDEDGKTREQYIGSYLRNRPAREMWVPDKNVAVQPAFLTGEAYQPTLGKPARQAYAEWMTDPNNPYFAKAIVNRIWAQLTGRGLVDPIDWFGKDHPPTHPELLNWLANDFVAHGYNLRYLVRAIVNTNAYQRSAKTMDQNRFDDQYLTHARIRPLTAEQLFYSLLEATNIEGREKRRQGDFEATKREYLNRYRFVFGNDERDEEVLAKATISQALMMLNGKFVNEGSLNRDGTRLDRILDTEFAMNRRVEAIYLAVLSRLPTGRERTYFRQYSQGSSYRDENKTYEDLYWSLLNTAEFATNH